MIKKWKYLFATQFLGVFNDNLLKSLICFVGVLWVAEESRADVIPAASALLVIPFILFSAFAGKIAVLKSKRNIVVTAKLLEIPIMLIAVTGFIFQSITLVMIALFFMGLQSAMFSPSKYGLIRDVGGVEGLSYGSGSMEMLSFVGVLLGSVIAGMISDIQGAMNFAVGASLLSVAVLGWLSSRRIVVTEPQIDTSFEGTANPFKFLWKNNKWAGKIKGLNTTVLGLGTFWLVGALLQMNLIVHCPREMGLSNTETSLVMAFVAIGIGLGCYVSGLLAKNRVELGIVPIGGFGLSICMSVIAFMELGTATFITMLFFGSFFSGLYKVPLSAWIQERVEGRKVGDILAYNNLIVFIFILLSSIIYAFVESAYGTQAIFIVVALISWLITIVTITKIPSMMLRFILYVLSHTFFRIKLEGVEHIPKKTGALIVTNHLSLIDSLLVVAAVPRMVRFVVHQKVYEHPMLFWLFKHLNIIPILPQGGPKALEEFNRTCQDQINKGHVVCIFPEGKITRTGQLNEFKKGIEHIAKDIDAPIIPMHMDNVIGSAFSYYPGSSAIYKLRRNTLKRNVSIKIGQHMPKDSTAFMARQRVIELNADIFANRIEEKDTLVKFFIEKAQIHPNSIYSFDENSNPVSYKRTLDEVVYIADSLKNQLTDNSVVAVLCKSSRISAVYNMALNLLGKTVINVSSSEAVQTQRLLAHTNSIICDGDESKGIASEFNVIETIKLPQKLKSTSVRSLDSIVRKYNPEMSRDQIATIIFDENEDGSIREIPLSQKNILSNILGLKQVHHITQNDSLLNVLSFSSPLGYTTNLWLPACLGLPAIWTQDSVNLSYQPSIIIGWQEHLDRLIERHLTIEPLKNVKHVISGHIKLSPDKEEWIKDNWKTEVRYGFGIPECGPVISINCPDYAIADLSGRTSVNKGTEDGTVGRSLPGVAVRIIGSDNNEEMRPDHEGKIAVKGPNVCNKEIENSDFEFRDGWLVTPIIGSLSSTGFLSLKSPDTLKV